MTSKPLAAELLKYQCGASSLSLPSIALQSGAPYRSSNMEKLQSLTLSDLQKVANIPPQYLKPLAAVGGLWAAYQLSSLTSFTWYHFLRPKTLNKYKKGGKGGEPWALVTGSSDGIGLGFAEELAQQGFNIVLHGRNEEKLQGVRDTLQAQWPARKFKIIILDAVRDAGDSAKIEAVVAELKSLNVKVLINNVGGGAGAKPTLQRFNTFTPELIDGWIDVNLRFPTHFTRQMLPQLIANQPALIVNIGSGASEISSPFLAVYSGAKAYNKAWSRSLAVELKDQGHDIDCQAVVVGQVATSRMKVDTSTTVPDVRTFARSALGYAGAGKKVVVSHWGHEFLFWTMSLMPEWVGENFVRTISKQIMMKEEKDAAEEAKKQ